MDYKLIIYKFLKQCLQIKEDKLLGVIFYGSSNCNMNNPSSDIDLLLITDIDRNFKGCVYIDGIKIDYYEKNIYDLIDEIQNLDSSRNRYLMSVFKNGSIILSKNQSVEYLKEEIMSKNQVSKARKNINYISSDIKELLKIFNSIETNSNFFEYIYYNLIETIRKIYHVQNGYSDLPSMKVYQLYSNQEYAKESFCILLPDQEFINLYLDLLINGYQKDKLEKLISLINYKKYNNKSFNHYTKNNLKYISTIVNNAVDKSIYYIESNNKNLMSCYYITLEKIRKLYCRINNIDESLSLFDNNYEEEFIKLFDICLSDSHNIENIKILFEYVSKSLNVDYKNYRILELL